MPSWEFTIALESRTDLPLFLQIARAVTEDVIRGRLRPGARLPGTRTLARTLRVHRNTILAAYGELLAEGWLTTRARGTFVSDALPHLPPRRFAARAAPRAEVPSRIGFELRGGAGGSIPAPYPAGTLSFAESLPDLRLLPIAQLARAYRRALRSPGRSVLGYGDPRGHIRLRRAIAAMVSTLRGLAAGEDEVLMTGGSQQAVTLLGRLLVTPGETIAIEALGYPPAWAALRNLGARLVPVPVDDSGLRVDALEALIRRERVRMVYVMPHHQYPTTVTLAPGRRLQLLEIARRHRIVVLEEDYDSEFHFEGRPVLPLASIDPAGVVVYVGTLSKILAPGLRLGFIVAPAVLISRLAELRLSVDRQGDQAVEWAVADLIEDGEVQRHARRARRIYLARRDALARALVKNMSSALSFRLPAGGMAIWARVAPGIDVELWSARALSCGVAFPAGRHYAFDGRSRPFTRLAYAAMNDQELGKAVERMASALK